MATKTESMGALSFFLDLPGTGPTTVPAVVLVSADTGDPSSGGSQSISGVRQDASGAAAANGAAHPFLFNKDGRLKVASAPAQYTPITGSVTAATQTVSADVTSCSNVVAHVTGTFAGHNSTFEGSIDGGTSWFTIQAVRSNANTIETATGALSAAPAYAWELSVNAFTNVRVRATAHTSGTANWRFTLGTYATEPIPAIQTHPVSQSGTWNVTPVTPTTNFLNSAATTNATAVKASAGTLWSAVATNTSASTRYLKLYNKASAPTVGTDVPVLVITLPATSTVNVSGGSNGVRFSTGIALAVTGAAGDTDTTAIGAAEIKVASTYT